MVNESVFDELAHDYDDAFSNRVPARWLRQRVREQVQPLLPTRGRVLDIGCGTGEDALWFAERGYTVDATDAAEGMLDQTAKKCSAAAPDIRSRITVRHFDAVSLGEVRPGFGGSYDCVHSNFGAMNCVPDLEQFFRWLDDVVAPNGFIALTLMGRFCAWETLGFALRGKFRQAGRRWNGHSVYETNDVRQSVWYHSPADVRKMAASCFDVASVSGIGSFIPSTEFFPVCENRPRLFKVLATLENNLAGFWPFSRIGDHYLIVLRRTS